MPRDRSKASFIECRPGLKAQMESTFPDLEVRVVDDLDVDYRFGEKALSPLEQIEAEVEKEELAAADPKNAINLVAPLGMKEDYVEAPSTEPDWWENLPFVLIRLDGSTISSYSARDVLAKVKLEFDQDDSSGEFTVNESATVSAIRQAFLDEGANVFSVSLTQELTWLK